GGTTWLLQACHRHDAPDTDFGQWLAQEKRILLHAGGQSRRLPAYAPSGKILTPIPVFRWKRGQRLDQNLLALEMPLYEQIMQKAPASLRTMVVSGDVFIRSTKPLQDIPEADVVCYGLWVDPNLAKNHGVFVSRRNSPGELDYMLQKPTVETLGELMQHSLFMMDIGVWLLSDRAIQLMVKHSMNADGNVGYYDMYSDFGRALGNHPQIQDEELNALSVAILPLPGGEFYHFGTSREMISSSLAVQNCVIDQRAIMHHRVKPHPAMFVQNARIAIPLTADNAELWIENSYVGARWTIEQQNIITGVPANDWEVHLQRGQCIDVVPMGETDWVARPYGFEDAFRGPLDQAETRYLGVPVTRWLEARGLSVTDIENHHDLQAARLFPVCHRTEDLGKVIRWMTSEPMLKEGEQIWKAAPKMSADEISAFANLRRLATQREKLRILSWNTISRNHERSVFYQLNLEHAAQEFATNGIALPDPLNENSETIKRISDSMFRARVKTLRGQDGTADEHKAFALMREGLTATANHKQHPQLAVFADQIVWSRSPVRIDVAGGWTDTPPYSLMQGGNVVNFAIELNGQPPLQVYV
ncbi:MAG: bifunctional fucokinase/L-fucose-1-P-guanylyltransferase, partial [Bacteroidaceae bacterium]|nr:bifunctional fucokinase/L-fucose-1-P-guanylyltransferase [Bacteroidaceae bacterium]